MEQLEFLVRPIAAKERNDGQRLFLRRPMTAAPAGFLRRTKGLADKQDSFQKPSPKSGSGVS
ncbi:MAG: hypothetical protein U0905_01005 [Pirellulales bacterium]